MPRLQLLYPDNFYKPLTEDVEELLARFQQTDTVRFELFSDIWRQMRFQEVFLGVHRQNELKSFCKITLNTAIKYFLPPYSYQIRVGGLYLMFAFYNTQTIVPPLLLRLPLRDWDSIHKFLKDSEEAGHLDVVYIYRKLFAAKAIYFTAMPNTLKYNHQRKMKSERMCSEFIGRSTVIQELLASEILEEQNNIQSQYEKLKKAMGDVSLQVNMTHQDLASRMKDCMSAFITWQNKTFSQSSKKKKKKKSSSEDDQSDEDESCSSRARLLSSIKQKSFRNVQQASKSRRHRQTENAGSAEEQDEEPRQRRPGERKKRPPSLRARTWKNLEVKEDDTAVQTWLLSAPEQPQEKKLPLKRKRIHPILYNDE